MDKRMIGWLCVCGMVLAVLAVSGCLHADIGNMRR